MPEEKLTACGECDSYYFNTLSSDFTGSSAEVGPMGHLLIHVCLHLGCKHEFDMVLGKMVPMPAIRACRRFNADGHCPDFEAKKGAPDAQTTE